MLYQIHNASPEALKRMPEGFDPSKAETTPLSDATDNRMRRVYPFHRMQIGHCFLVPFIVGGIATDFQNSRLSAKLRSIASRASSKMGKKFAVIKHNEHKLFEVARIA